MLPGADPDLPATLLGGLPLGLQQLQLSQDLLLSSLGPGQVHVQLCGERSQLLRVPCTLGVRQAGKKAGVPFFSPGPSLCHC